jgi:hypothetical protein
VTVPSRPAADPDAVFKALTPAERAVLDDSRRLLGLGKHWTRARSFARAFEFLAWARLTTTIQEREGVGLTAAQDTAAAKLGLDGESLRRQLRRARKQILDPQQIPDVLSSTRGDAAA